MADELGAGQDWAARLKRALVQGAAPAQPAPVSAVPAPVSDPPGEAPAEPAAEAPVPQPAPATGLLAALSLAPVTAPSAAAPPPVLSSVPAPSPGPGAAPAPSSLLALLEPGGAAEPAALPGLLAALTNPSPAMAVREPAPEPAAEAASEAAPEPVAEAAPEPAPEPAPEAAPEAVAEAASAPEPEPEPAPAPAPEPVPEPGAEAPQLSEPPPGLLAALADPALAFATEATAPAAPPAVAPTTPTVEKPPRRAATTPKLARPKSTPEPAFEPADFATAHATLLGVPPGKSAQQAGAAAQDEWIALARSILGAEGTWHGLALGGRSANLLVAAGMGAKRRGLAPRLLAVEAEPEPFSRLHAAVSAQSFTAAEFRLLQAEVCASVADLAPRAAAAEQLLAEMPRCDYLRVSMRGLIEPLLASQMTLLSEKLRWLVLNSRNRREEHQALTLLSQAGWQLLADHPCTIDKLAPPRISKAGTQVWRSPLA